MRTDATVTLGNDAAVCLDTRILSCVFYGIMFMATIGVTLSFSSKTMSGTGQGDIVRQLSYCLFLFTILFVAINYGNLSHVFSVPAPIVVVLVWCWITIFWSLAPDIATRRMILTTMMVWMMFMFTRQLGYEKIISLLRISLVSLLIISYIAVIVAPSFAIHQVSDHSDLNLIGCWRGIFFHKNVAGPMCVFTALLFILDASKIRRIVRVFIVLASIFFLYKSGSKTCLALLFPTSLIGFAYANLSPYYRKVAIPFIAILCLVALAFGYTYEHRITSYLTDADALTGRGSIWKPMIAYAQEHWLGAGFGSFWNVGAETPIYRYAKGWIVELGNGHNGYLDLLTQIGVPGLLLVISAVVIWPISKMLTCATTPPAAGGLALSMLIFGLLANMTETSVLDRDMVVNLLIMLSIGLIVELTRPVLQPRLGVLQSRRLMRERSRRTALAIKAGDRQ